MGEEHFNQVALSLVPGLGPVTIRQLISYCGSATAVLNAKPARLKAIPGIGEFSDVIWAPLAAWLMTRMYKGKIGQAAGVVTFVEELVPGLDVVPTFTIMWIYTYVLSGKKAKKILDV